MNRICVRGIALAALGIITSLQAQESATPSPTRAFLYMRNSTHYDLTLVPFSTSHKSSSKSDLLKRARSPIAAGNWFSVQASKPYSVYINGSFSFVIELTHDRIQKKLILELYKNFDAHDSFSQVVIDENDAVKTAAQIVYNGDPLPHLATLVLPKSLQDRPRLSTPVSADDLQSSASYQELYPPEDPDSDYFFPLPLTDEERKELGLFELRPASKGLERAITPLSPSTPSPERERQTRKISMPTTPRARPVSRAGKPQSPTPVKTRRAQSAAAATCESDASSSSRSSSNEA